MGNLIENRQIRVFISSTFRDMQDERDHLMTLITLTSLLQLMRDLEDTMRL